MQEKPIVSTVRGEIQIKFISDDNKIALFDLSWNVVIDEFSLIKISEDKLKVGFTFESRLIKRMPNGKLITTIPWEGLTELYPVLEKLEILLDILTLHVGLPLGVINGSLKLYGAGYGSSTNSISNAYSLKDIAGIQKRFKNIHGNEDLINAIRFYRLSLMDQEYSGKGTKLWASLEALYKRKKVTVPSIWSLISPEKRIVIQKLIESLSIDKRFKKKLIGKLSGQKQCSDKEMLAQQLKLMSAEGEYSQEEISKLLGWWSDSRNAPAHGERILKNDEKKIDAIDDMQDTLENLLHGGLKPPMLVYFIGHPKDVGDGFWDDKDYTIKKVSEVCWVKPESWGDYLLTNIGSHIVQENGPLIYVSHDKIIQIKKDSQSEITDLSTLPITYQITIKRIREKFID